MKIGNLTQSLRKSRYFKYVFSSFTSIFGFLSGFHRRTKITLSGKIGSKIINLLKKTFSFFSFLFRHLILSPLGIASFILVWHAVLGNIKPEGFTGTEIDSEGNYLIDCPDGYAYRLKQEDLLYDLYLPCEDFNEYFTEFEEAKSKGRLLEFKAKWTRRLLEYPEELKKYHEDLAKALNKIGGKHD